LFEQQENDVDQDGKFRWPHFTVRNRPHPGAPWAPPPVTYAISDHGSDDGMSDDGVIHVEFGEEQRKNAMENLATTMTYNSSVHVGQVHRFLCKPLDDEEQLAKDLERASVDALTFVCLDLNRMPPMPSSDKITKDLLIPQLIIWVSLFVNHTT